MISWCPAQNQISLGICPVWSVFTVYTLKSLLLSNLLSAQRRLIRLGGCPCWSDFPESPVILLVFSCAGSVVVKTVQISRPITLEPTGAVAQLLERPVWVREVVGSIPSQVIPKTLKIVIGALLDSMTTLAQRRHWVVSLADGYPSLSNAGPTLGKPWYQSNESFKVSKIMS